VVFFDQSKRSFFIWVKFVAFRVFCFIYIVFWYRVKLGLLISSKLIH